MKKLQIVQTSVFSRAIKKLHQGQIKELNKIILKISEEPSMGIPKKGDLSGVFVHKFKLNNTLILLAYSYNKSELQLLALGSHQNFYRDLKN